MGMVKIYGKEQVENKYPSVGTDGDFILNVLYKLNQVDHKDGVIFYVMHCMNHVLYTLTVFS